MKTLIKKYVKVTGIEKHYIIEAAHRNLLNGGHHNIKKTLPNLKSEKFCSSCN